MIYTAGQLFREFRDVEIGQEKAKELLEKWPMILKHCLEMGSQPYYVVLEIAKAEKLEDPVWIKFVQEHGWVPHDQEQLERVVGRPLER